MSSTADEAERKFLSEYSLRRSVAPGWDSVRWLDEVYPGDANVNSTTKWAEKLRVLMGSPRMERQLKLAIDLIDLFSDAGVQPATDPKRVITLARLKRLALFVDSRCFVDVDTAKLPSVKPYPIRSRSDTHVPIRWTRESIAQIDSTDRAGYLGVIEDVDRECARKLDWLKRKWALPTWQPFQLDAPVRRLTQMRQDKSPLDRRAVVDTRVPDPALELPLIVYLGREDSPKHLGVSYLDHRGRDVQSVFDFGGVPADKDVRNMHRHSRRAMWAFFPEYTGWTTPVELKCPEGSVAGLKDGVVACRRNGWMGPHVDDIYRQMFLSPSKAPPELASLFGPSGRPYSAGHVRQMYLWVGGGGIFRAAATSNPLYEEFDELDRPLLSIARARLKWLQQAIRLPFFTLYPDDAIVRKRILDQLGAIFYLSTSVPGRVPTVRQVTEGSTVREVRTDQDVNYDGILVAAGTGNFPTYSPNVYASER